MTSEREQEREWVRPDDGLIALYAERVQSRSRAAVRPRQNRPAPSLRQFGRGPRPVLRPRRSLQRGATVTALVATALVAGGQAASAATTHRVVAGETLTGIADQYQVSIEQIASLNAIANPDLIITDSVLTIDAEPSPESGASSPTASVGSSATLKHHRVLKGESLGLIADNYGVTLLALMQANGLENPDLIEVDVDLSIPAVGSNATQTASIPFSTGGLALHLVAEGETLGEIAKQYGATYQALASANALVDPNLIEAGQILRIPGAGTVQQGDAVKLKGMPVMQQSLPLSCEAAAVSMATAYWGNQVSEWVFIENMPKSPNPHEGFRGSMTGAFGSTADYGVYAEPFEPLLNRYGFAGDVFYADGDADLLKEQIDLGRPVVVWISNMVSAQERSYAWYDGSRFALVPQEHAVVVYGYDDERVYVADPGDGAFRQFGWEDFMRSWGYFDGMSLAVYPRG